MSSGALRLPLHNTLVDEVPGAQPQARGAENSDESLECPTPNVKYRTGNVLHFGVGDGYVLLHSAATGTTRAAPAIVATLLQRCAQFDTVTGHALNLARTLGGPAGFYESLLNDLRSSGFLAASDELGYGTGSDARTQVRIGTVGWVTCDRPEQLRRSMTTYIRNSGRHGKSCAFAVFDDSNERDARAALRDNLRAQARRWGVTILYAGQEEKLEYAKALQQHSGIPADVIRFALFDTHGCGRRVGANRNAFLLHAAGEPLLSLDDDTVCSVGQPQGATPGLVFSSAHDPAENWVFANREAAREAVLPVDVDFVGAHEEYLGRTISESVASLPIAMCPELGNMRAAGVDALRCRGGRILGTLTGLAGDCGLEEADWSTLDGTSRQRVACAGESYASLRRSREIVRAVQRVTINEGAFWMMLATGLDGRELLPPFLPVLRNQDGVFAGILRKCVPTGYLCHLPYTVLHAPSECRPSSSARQTGRFLRLSDWILCSLARWRRPVGASTERALRSFGQELAAIGDLARGDFTNLFRAEVSARLSRWIQELELSKERDGDVCSEWELDRAELVRQMEVSLESSDGFLPADLVAGRTPEQAGEMAQRVIYDFGRLLTHWPEIVRAAQELRAKGILLARPV
jgi:hypothetical protein